MDVFVRSISAANGEPALAKLFSTVSIPITICDKYHWLDTYVWAFVIDISGNSNFPSRPVSHRMGYCMYRVKVTVVKLIAGQRTNQHLCETAKNAWSASQKWKCLSRARWAMTPTLPRIYPLVSLYYFLNCSLFSLTP